jgi:hypothetical protein
MSCRAIQLAVSVLLLGVLLWWIGIERLVSQALTIKPQFALLALGLQLIQNDCATRRWTTILRAFKEPPSHLRMLRFQYMALFTQLFLPSSIGGATVRVGVLLRSGYPLGIAVNSVLLDRIVAFGGLVLLAIIFLPAVASSLSLGGSAGRLAVVVVSAIGALGALGAALWWRPMSFWLGLLKRTPLKFLADPLELAIPNLIRPRTVTVAFVLSLFGQFAAIVSIFILAVGMELHVGLLDCILVMPPVMLLAALPISIAGWGVREGAMVVAFGLLEIPPESALLLSVQFAIIGHIATTPGAIAWLLEVDREAYGRIAKRIEAARGD